VVHLFFMALACFPNGNMNYSDTVHFQFDSQGVDWQLLLRLFKATNMGGREGGAVRSIKPVRSQVAVFAFSWPLPFPIERGVLNRTAGLIAVGEFMRLIVGAALIQRQNRLLPKACLPMTQFLC